MRLYNDGVAFRYDGLSDKEKTAYKISQGTKRWMMKWSDGYEGFFPLTTKATDGRWGYPALLEPADGVFVLLSEANICKGQAASSLHSKGDLYQVVPDGATSNLKSQTSNLKSPWRVAIIGSLADVVESTLITDVSEPSKIEDTSWIHPGTVSWVYWAYNQPVGFIQAPCHGSIGPIIMVPTTITSSRNTWIWQWRCSCPTS